SSEATAVRAVQSGRLVVSVVFFFFSSRRRHTRWPRDWSSDVCSSDLRDEMKTPRDEELAKAEAVHAEAVALRDQYQRELDRYDRSEERRVGKECRSRWVP